MNPITWSDFEKVDIRIGTVVSAQEFPQARKPAIQMNIDFGSEIGILKTSAQITHYYRPEDLVGKQVMAVVNFPPKQIGPLMSQCLVLGAVPEQGVVSLLQPNHPVPPGTKVS